MATIVILSLLTLLRFSLPRRHISLLQLAQKNRVYLVDALSPRVDFPALVQALFTKFTMKGRTTLCLQEDGP